MTIGAIPFLAAVLASSSAADVRNVNGWQISSHASRCSMISTFGENISIFLSYAARNDDADLAIVDPSFRSIKAGDRHRLDVIFIRSSRILGEYESTEFVGIELENGDRAVRALFAGRDFLSDFAGADSMHVMRGSTRIAAIKLDGSSTAVNAMRSCAQKAEAANPTDPFEDAVPVNGSSRGFGARAVEARGTPSSWITSADYPREALAARLQGTVGVRVEVGADGRISNCRVVDSSGSQILDDTTCRIIERRARYRAAQDADGEPIPSSATHRFNWKLPE